MKLNFAQATNMDAFASSFFKGNDTITGSLYNDKLRGYDGNDHIYGRLGRDVLYGGLGRDILSGGDGADRFVFKKTADSWRGPDEKNMDMILDFDRKEGDKLDFRFIDANEQRSGNNAFTYIGTRDFTGRAGELTIEKTKKGLYVEADTNGDQTPDFVVFLKGMSSISKGDFYL
jgi:Ca2+-binding RTX toxin-like protein